MNERLKEKLRHVPDKPGCYIMRDRSGRIIYVGKAVSLKRRVASYFRASTMRGGAPKLRSLVNSVEDIEFVTVRTEAQALVTESKLIKDYKPRYNIVLRDDKRYLALKAERHLEFPRFSECRIIRDDGAEYFGPFPSSAVVRSVKDFAERHFGIRKCPAASPCADDHKHCHNDRIACCSAPCAGAIAPDEYRVRFEQACAFIKRGDPAVMEQLKTRMAEAALAEDYENAAKLRDTLLAINDLHKLGAQSSSAPPNPLSRRAAPAAAEGIAALAELLGLPAPPRLIEGFDISHISGTFVVASMVAAVDGAPAPQRYRRFRVKTVEGVDDPASIAEVVRRRYARVLEESLELPGLVMVDGGVTQLRAARAELAALGLENLPAIGLAKRLEEIVVDMPDCVSMILDRDSPALKVLIRLRDEAHRFAITYNRNLRRKKITESIIDEIDGVGESRKFALLKKFGSVRRIASAEESEIAKVAGIGPVLAKQIKAAAQRVSPSGL